MKRGLDFHFGELSRWLDPITLGLDTFIDEVHGLASRYVGYPPYNMIRTEECTCIEVALAGLSKKDVQVYVENKTLHIKHEKTEKENVAYVHQGIAQRDFCLSFKILEKITVESAEMKDGLLKITLKKVEPEIDKNIITIS